MHGKKRDIKFLILGILCLMILGWFLFSYSPSEAINIKGININTLPVFLLLIFLSIFSLTGFILKNLRRGLLISLSLVAYLIIRLLGLTNPFFPVLILALAVIIELFFSKKD